MNATEHRPAAPQAPATEHRPAALQSEAQGPPSVTDHSIELHVRAVSSESLTTVSLLTEPLCDITGNKALTLPQK